MNRIAARNPFSQARLQQVVTDLATRGQQWRDLVRYSEESRWYRRLVGRVCANFLRIVMKALLNLFR